jgi:shikimate kinase
MGYYDHHPTLSLREPLALIGFMGAGVQRIGHGLAARTGLPIHDIDRLIEQRAGMSRARLVIEQGDAARRAVEAERIGAALRATPPGIIVLGDGALIDPETRRAVGEQAHLVYVERPLPVLFAGILRERERAPGSIPEFVIAPPRSPDDLLAYFEERAPGYASARTTLRARNLHGAHVVDTILEALRDGSGPGARPI